VDYASIMAKTPKERLIRKARQVSALPWRLAEDGGLEFLLVTSRTNKHWLLPKGWPIPGKSGFESALQEAYEEAGIYAKGPDTPLGKYAFTKVLHDLTELPCTMSVYAVNGVNELEDWPEKSERDRLWFTQAEAVSITFDFNLSLFLSAVLYDKKRKRLKIDSKLAPPEPKGKK
jgi:8-oxo-dGTP pyrophosphatase MutT (NUDIX family)